MPRVLAALLSSDDEAARAELWFALWRMLHRPGQSLSAAYAAAPHLLSTVEQRPLEERANAAHLLTRIELARLAAGSADMPDFVLAGYAAALGRLPVLVAEAASDEWDQMLAPIFLAALAVGKRQPALAEAVLQTGLGE